MTVVTLTFAVKVTLLLIVKLLNVKVPGLPELSFIKPIQLVLLANVISAGVAAAVLTIVPMIPVKTVGELEIAPAEVVIEPVNVSEALGYNAILPPPPLPP